MAVTVKEEAKGIFRIGPLQSAHPGRTGHHSSLTSPFLAVGSERVWVLEPGEDVQVPGTLEALKQLGLGLDRVEYVWASHIHLHHIQGLPQLLRELPRAKFLVHPRGAPHVVETTRLVETTIQVWGDKCYGPFGGIPQAKVAPVQDGQVFDLGGKELEIIYAPGHAPHHMGLFDRQTKVLFPGDLNTGANSFGGPGGSSPTIFDTEKFLSSLRRFQDFNPSMVLTFGQHEVLPVEILKYAEVDHIVVERACLEGMKQKMSMAEINRRVELIREWIRAGEHQGGESEQAIRAEQGAPANMIAYLLRKHPELEMPSGPRRARTASVRE